MEQNELFIETRRQAVEALASQIGGMKRLAGMLSPRDPVDTAYRRLMNELNEDRREVFSADTWDAVRQIGLENGIHICQHWDTDRNSYNRTTAAAPKSQKVKLMELAEVHARKARELMEQAEQAGAMEQVRDLRAAS